MLKNALKVRNDLTAAGKTPEELPAALGEALKMEGDRLTRLMGAVETIDGRPVGELKRVLVMQTTAEGEKAPEGAVQKGELWYVMEQLAPPVKTMPEDRGGGRDGRGGRGGRGGRDGRGGGRPGGPGGRDGGRGGDRGGRGPGAGGGPKPQA